MPLFNSVLFKRCILLTFLSATSAKAYAHCDFMCFGEESPWQITQFTGFGLATTVLSPFTATQEMSGLNKRVYSVQEVEAAQFYLASEGMLEAAYFTSALKRFRQETPDALLNDLAVAALISSQ
ncbi:DUF2388 domain-containing protein [Pseudomonas sp. P9_31]|uniref:DUF2388 domain-containing protein n=1 Tax=Pseudomonas sp. P9_31 TaxID=3043448 RepID=UPI002A36ADB9|nr:DUF2388 domain-containing protein [Pseudomonas sp. P9_31]WPN56001.1 DUF2388 domain-containing protein [Pseudomonas sp. P9_31]